MSAIPQPHGRSQNPSDALQVVVRYSIRVSLEGCLHAAHSGSVTARENNPCKGCGKEKPNYTTLCQTTQGITGSWCQLRNEIQRRSLPSNWHIQQSFTWASVSSDHLQQSGLKSKTLKQDAQAHITPEKTHTLLPSLLRGFLELLPPANTQHHVALQTFYGWSAARQASRTGGR